MSFLKRAGIESQHTPGLALISSSRPRTKSKNAGDEQLKPASQAFYLLNKSICVCAWYMHVGPHVAGICICTCVKIRGVLLQQCLPYSLTESLTELVARCAPISLLACSDEFPEILLLLLLVLLPKPFLLHGIEIWEATLRFFMEPRVPNLCSKHLTYCAVFPAQEYLLITKNKLTWWGTSVIQTLGKQRWEDTYKFKASLIYLAGSQTTGPISKKKKIKKLNEYITNKIIILIEKLANNFIRQFFRVIEVNGIFMKYGQQN